MLRSLQQYPRQFRLMFFGMFISTVGSSMIWPFLMIYVKERLDLPLSTVTGLTSINAATGLLAALLAGPITDRFGRKWVMVFSLFFNGLVYALQSQADSLQAFAILMAFSGIFNPLYRVASDAMLADLVPPEKRPEAYALLRMSNNTGIAVGPALGGFIATISYTVAFFIAAAGLAAYGLLMFFFAVETLPKRSSPPPASELLRGYLHILKDGHFTLFALAFVLTQMCATLMWVLLPVFAKTEYQIPENVYGWIPTTNAVMVVFLQMYVTTRSRKHKPLSMMALGTLFYAIGVGSIALGRGFAGFWIAMVVMTIGELIAMPTASTYVAGLAPADMRGRYMSVFSLTWNVAYGIAPRMGGNLYDYIGPQAPWIAGLVIGLIAVLAYTMLSRKWSKIIPS